MRKIVLRLKASDRKILDNCIEAINNTFIDFFDKNDYAIYTISSFPKTDKKITVLNSPHVDKRSKKSYKTIFYTKDVSIEVKNKLWSNKIFLLLKSINVTNTNLIEFKISIHT